MTTPAITTERVKELIGVATSGLDGIENLLKQARYDLDKKILEDGRDRWADLLAILTDYEAVRGENEELRDYDNEMAERVEEQSARAEKAEAEVVALKLANELTAASLIKVNEQLKADLKASEAEATDLQHELALAAPLIEAVMKAKITASGTIQHYWREQIIGYALSLRQKKEKP